MPVTARAIAVAPKPIIKKNLVKEEYQSELCGQVACYGNVSGKVCIINDEKELRKMQEGNILVSIMTNPNMFPAMKIAKGIITDVGGLSCHAAIVARELQIPCIVGTKWATKVLKEGMLVKLDSETGTVKIINEKNINQNSVSEENETKTAHPLVP